MKVLVQGQLINSVKLVDFKKEQFFNENFLNCAYDSFDVV